MEARHHLNVELRAALVPAGSDSRVNICRTNARYLYYSLTLQLTHHAVGGCAMCVQILARDRGLRIAAKRGHKRAVVAVARKLAVIMHRMWLDGSEFRFAASDWT